MREYVQLWPSDIAPIGACGTDEALDRNQLLALLVLTVGLRSGFGGAFSDNGSLPGTQSHTGLTLLNASESTAGGFSGKVVLHASSATVADHRSTVESAVTVTRTIPHVLSVSTRSRRGTCPLTAQSRWRR